MDITPNTGVENSTTPSNDFIAGESIESVESALKGENSHVFRVAESQLDTHEHYHPTVRVERPLTRSVEEMASLEPSFVQHQPVTGQPFTASYLNLDKTFSSLSSAEKAPITAIDSYVHSKIEAGELQDSAKAVTEFIKELEAKINLKDYHDPYYRAEKLSGYIANLGKYNKQRTLKARLTKSVAEEQQQQTRTLKKLEQHVKTAGELPTDLDKRIAANSREIRKLGEKIVEPDMTPVRVMSEKVEKLNTEIVPAINESIASLINLNKRALQRVNDVMEVAEGSIHKSREITTKYESTKKALTKLLEKI